MRTMISKLVFATLLGLVVIGSAAAADIEKAFGAGAVSGKIQGHVFVVSK